MAALGESGKPGHAGSAKVLEGESGSSAKMDLGVAGLRAFVLSGLELPVYINSFM